MTAPPSFAIIFGAPTYMGSASATEEALNRHSYFFGHGAQSNADQSADDAATESGLKTAEHLGARVAGVARELAAGRRALAAA